MDHGTEVVVIVVGRGDTQTEFAIHKQLICDFSTFFYQIFNGAFRESAEQRMEFSDENPMVFEAFYEWLYAQNTKSSYHYTNGDVAAAQFWLCLYRMGERLLVAGSFQGLARDRFKHLFPQDAEIIPSTKLIREIFAEDPLLATFEEHLVRHTVYCLGKSSPFISQSRLNEWKEALRADACFGIAVAVTLTEMRSLLYRRIKSECSDGFQIHIELWTGDTVAVKVKISDTTRDMKAKIPGCSIHQQRVWLNDIELRNGRPLFDFAIEPKSVLRLSCLEPHRHPSDTIDRVKSEIYGEAGIDVTEQRLICKGLELEDGRTLRSYDLRNRDTIHLVLRLRGFACGCIDPMTGAEFMPLYVNTVDGRTMTLEVRYSETPNRVNSLIQQYGGAPVRYQRLLYEGKELEDGFTLSQLRIQTASTVGQVLRMGIDSLTGANARSNCQVRYLALRLSHRSCKISKGDRAL